MVKSTKMCSLFFIYIVNIENYLINYITNYIKDIEELAFN
ncbi:hypothetical protein SDC9_121628 [bioreactor metagenome]|uniref:Uncharacterized protein n=1 Tax=bioreactor metagenome TaxID=1076179 RepID=A0A645CCH6_9ZZZZ